MIVGGNWWRANEIVIRHLTRPGVLSARILFSVDLIGVLPKLWDLHLMLDAPGLRRLAPSPEEGVAAIEIR